MDIKSIINSVVSKGQSYFSKIPSELESYKEKFGGLSINAPDVNIDVNGITNTIMGKSDLNIDPNKMVQDVMKDYKPMNTSSLMSDIESSYQPIDTSSFKDIALDTSSIEMPNMEEEIKKYSSLSNISIM